MIDPNKVIRNTLLKSPKLVTLVGSRIYQGLLPHGYSIDNPAITFSTRGGESYPGLPFLSESVEFKCWAGSHVLAMDVARTLSDFLLQPDIRSINGNVLSVSEETFGTPYIDPDVGWDYVLSFYNFSLVK